MVEVQIGDERNSNVFFRPTGKTLRGTFDLNNVAEPRARLLTNRWPRPIPGVRVVVNETTAAIVEPLYDAEHTLTRERIESMGLKLAPQRETFENIDANTWLFWLARAVASGSAKIVKGEFPAIDESKVKKSFITEAVVDPRDKLIDKLVAVLFASLPADRRKEVASLIGV